MKRVVVIGSGNVAEILAGAIAASEYVPVQIFARNRERGEYIAGKVGCGWTDDPKSLAEADIYLISVSDTAVGPIARTLDFGGSVVAHTAGSVSIDELSGCSEHTGVFYPLQSFTAGRSLDLHGVPFFIEGSSDRAVESLRDLGDALSGRVIEIRSEERKRLHLAAVFVSNFANHMFALGENLLEEYGLSAEWIKPLMRETADKALQASSATTVQTAPARRNDLETQRKHLELLQDWPRMQQLYKMISQSIWETSKKI